MRLEEATSNDFARLTEALAGTRQLLTPAADRFNRVSIFLGLDSVLDILMGVDSSSDVGIDLGVVTHSIGNALKLQRRAG